MWAIAVVLGALFAAPARAQSGPVASAAAAPSSESSVSQPLGFVRGFADVGAGYSGGDGDAGFHVGSLDLYFTPQLSARVKSLIELVFEFTDTGELAVDLERLQVGYAFAEGATVWLGRFHTPLGYWNTAYHHGQQLQTSITRPRFIDFEDKGGVLPVHTLGVFIAGSPRVLGGRIRYDAFVGNSPSLADGTLDPRNVGGPDTSLSAGFNVGYRPSGRLDGLTVGIHGYQAKVRDTDAIESTFALRTLGGYAGLESDTWELLAEYYHFRNHEVSANGAGPNSWAGFVQFGRRFDRVIPYGRVEEGSFARGDGFFSRQRFGQSYEQWSLGVRYDVTPSAALKVEAYRVTEQDLDRRESGARLQWAIHF